MVCMFSKYSFTMRHVKGKDNVILDTLFRLMKSQILPCIAMMASSSPSSSKDQPKKHILNHITFPFTRSQGIFWILMVSLSLPHNTFEFQAHHFRDVLQILKIDLLPHHPRPYYPITRCCDLFKSFLTWLQPISF